MDFVLRCLIDGDLILEYFTDRQESKLKELSELVFHYAQHEDQYEFYLIGPGFYAVKGFLFGYHNTDESNANLILKKLKEEYKFKIYHVTQEIKKMADECDISDTLSAIEFCCAIHGGFDVIVTENPQNFAHENTMENSVKIMGVSDLESEYNRRKSELENFRNKLENTYFGLEKTTVPNEQELTEEKSSLDTVPNKLNPDFTQLENPSLDCKLSSVSYSSNIKSLRESKGYSYEQLAFLTGKTPEIVQAWEKGSQLENLILLQEISHHLNCKIEDLITRKLTRNQSNIKSLREERELSQGQLAFVLGKTPDLIEEWETGKGVQFQEFLVFFELAEHFNCSVQDLMIVATIDDNSPAIVAKELDDDNQAIVAEELIENSDQEN